MCNRFFIGSLILFGSCSHTSYAQSELDAGRKELEKQGYNYSPKIVQKGKKSYSKRELVYVQELLDSTNSQVGKVYVELLNDSVFKRLYIFQGEQLLYFVGDNLLTNGVDSTRFRSGLGHRFELRCKQYIVICIASEKGVCSSDPWTIKFIEKKKRFDNPYRNL